LIDGGESPRSIKNLLNNAIYNEVMNIDIDASILEGKAVPLTDNDDFTG